MLHAQNGVVSQDSLIVRDSVVVRDSVTAQPARIVKASIFRRVATDGVNTGETIIRTYARPFHWQKRDFLRLGGALAISASALLVDEKVYAFAQRNQNKAFDQVERVGFWLGKPTVNYPFMLIVWGSGVITKNDWLRDTGIMVIASVTTSGLIQTASKELVGRSRPQSERGAFLFRPLGGSAYHSFPSGHTMLSIATSWVLARQVSYVPLKIVFYALPVITGASRIYVGAHWLSDVLLGSALGIACAEGVLRLYPVIKAKRAYSINIIPSLNGAGVVVGF